ncbi:protein PML isoform X2 [Oenanthe melanoleuca]|uniref:protein PML isoform X2 n=1 Tax=Oenanthe melanoleuca TaxID=2939378 RepID=UPI0024C11E62|nr:protein PML isoform X2 [Oenanthe melanoleuca]XP_056355660.1 protein PML isoform X2 [Oenanthe melanoleuca]
MPDSPAEPPPPPAADGTADGAEAPAEPRPAAGGEEEEEEDEDEDFQFLRCEGCGQDSARPRLLSCLHTLCPGCLSDTKQCPLCRAAAGAPAMDNLLFANLRSRLQLWRQIRSSGGPGCSRCKGEAALVWCSDCEEFFCAKCFEEHQWWHKKKAHRVRRVEELRAGSARQFLDDTKSSCSLFCSSASHPEESRVCSIYCPRCERALCCPCALLDTGHAPFRDLRAESRRRQDELRSLRRDLRRLRGGFEAALARLRSEAARREEQRERLRERVRASAERLEQLVRREAEELRALLEARPERGRGALAEELSGAEGALLRLEAAERLVERLGRYGGEQELMDMQPFVKGALLQLQRLRPPQPPELREPPHFAQCRARLRALVERVTGRPDVPEVEVALEDNPEEDPTHPKIQSVSSLEEIHVEQPLPRSSCSKRPLPCMERGSQMSPKILKLECEHEAGPSRGQSHWEFREPGPSAAQRGCGDTGGHRHWHRARYPIAPIPGHPSWPCCASIQREPWPRMWILQICGRWAASSSAALTTATRTPWWWR